MIRRMFRSISSRFYSAVNRNLYRKYSLAAGDAYSEKFLQGDNGAPPLDQYIQCYNAFESYPRRALFYLNKAQDFETALIPASEGSYDLEKGLLLKDKNFLAQALDTLNPVWERELISKCYREFAHQDTGRGARQIAAEELFALNRGALLQAGISLPLEINLRNAGKKERNLYRALAKTGFIQAQNAARFKLTIDIGDTFASCELIDTESEVKPLRRLIPLHSPSRPDIYDFAETLSKSAFRIE
jgi:hypothetical protein